MVAQTNDCGVRQGGKGSIEKRGVEERRASEVCGPEKREEKRRGRKESSKLVVFELWRKKNKRDKRMKETQKKKKR